MSVLSRFLLLLAQARLQDLQIALQLLNAGGLRGVFALQAIDLRLPRGVFLSGLGLFVRIGFDRRCAQEGGGLLHFSSISVLDAQAHFYVVGGGLIGVGGALQVLRRQGKVRDAFPSVMDKEPRTAEATGRAAWFHSI